MNQSLIASLECSVLLLLSIWQTSIFVSDCHFFVSRNWRRSFCIDYVFHLDNKCVFFVGGTPVGKRFYDLLGMWGMFWWSGNETPGSKHLHRSNILFDSFNLSHSSNKFSVFGFSGNLSLFWFKTSFNLFWVQ